jgi:hypothetical protein
MQLNPPNQLLNGGDNFVVTLIKSGSGDIIVERQL